MGFYDSFPPADPKSPLDNNRHHYFFAHYALRVAAFQHHLMMFPILTSPERSGFFNELLEVMDKHLGPEDGTRSFSADDIRFAGFNIDGRPCAMVIMPPASQATEAHFVAILSRLTTEEMTWDVMNQEYAEPPIDYYTLELAAFPTEADKGIFCSWSQDDKHTNLGLGSRPTPSAFADFLRDYVNQAPR